MKVDFEYEELRKYAGCKCSITLDKSNYKYKGMLFMIPNTKNIYFFSNNKTFSGETSYYRKDFGYKYSYWLVSPTNWKDTWLKHHLRILSIEDCDRDLGEL